MAWCFLLFNCSLKYWLQCSLIPIHVFALLQFTRLTRQMKESWVTVMVIDQNTCTWMCLCPELCEQPTPTTMALCGTTIPTTIHSTQPGRHSHQLAICKRESCSALSFQFTGLFHCRDSLCTRYASFPYWDRNTQCGWLHITIPRAQKSMINKLLQFQMS